LISGKFANKLKRQHEFYIEKIAEKRAEENEKSTKKEQAEKHAEKMAAQAKKALEKKREAEAAKAQTTAGPGMIQQFVANIQDAPQGDNRLL